MTVLYLLSITEVIANVLQQEDAVQHALSGRRVADVNPGKPLNKKQRSAQNMRIRGLIKEKKERKKEANKKRREQERKTKIEAAKKIKALEKAARERMSSSGKSASDGSVYKPTTTDETSEETTSVPTSSVIDQGAEQAAGVRRPETKIKDISEREEFQDILETIAGNQKSLLSGQKDLAKTVKDQLEVRN